MYKQDFESIVKPFERVIYKSGNSFVITVPIKHIKDNKLKLGEDYLFYICNKKYKQKIFPFKSKIWKINNHSFVFTVPMFNIKSGIVINKKKYLVKIKKGDLVDSN